MSACGCITGEKLCPSARRLWQRQKTLHAELLPVFIARNEDLGDGVKAAALFVGAQELATAERAFRTHVIEASKNPKAAA